ncbi:MAG: VCBS repeat-containing protein [Bacteroidota bacterium]
MKKIIFCSFLTSFYTLTVSGQMKTLFSKIAPEASGVDFKNIIIETKDFNALTYGYLYNGGGVAIGDINNDGRPDLYFSGSMVPNKLYLNQGNFKFKDITESAGVDGGKGFKTGVTFVDINSDGLPDIYMCKSALSDPELRKNILYVNNGNMTFTDKAKEYGLDDASFSTQAYFYDLDVDGDLDLFLLNHPPEMQYANKIQLTYNPKGKLVAQQDTQYTNSSYRYYQNTNNHFTDKTDAAGLKTHSFGLSAVIDDFNKDGYPDIYACNDYSSPDLLFINNKNGTFTNRLDEYFKHTSYSSMGSDYADINNDGLSDLIVVDMLPESFERQKQLKGIGNYDNHNKRVEYGFGYQYAKNVLQLNNGNNTYSDISYLANVAFTEWSWAPLIADFDNDGFKDLFITNGYMRDVTDNDFVMFQADSIRKEVVKTASSDQVMKILNLIPSKKTVNYFYKNGGNLTFAPLAQLAGLDTPSWSNGAAYVDLDADGDLDLVVNNVYDPPFIYKNNAEEIPNTNNFIRFKLKGNKGNFNGIGAVINLETPDGRKQMQNFMPTRGFMSSHEYIVHFGLEKNSRATAIITWPSGKSQTIVNLEANRVYTLSADEATEIPKTAEIEKVPYKDISAETNILYTHKENSYIDFKLEPLLPHQFSQMGPCIAVADINGDGTEDFFVGGSKNNEAVFFKQGKNGKFEQVKSPALSADLKFEDTGAEFFDADNDGDKDLLVVSGGNDSPNNESMYPVRLYNNDGKGNFTKNTAFPALFTSGKAIAIEDFNKDGFQDIFIGGRVVPGHYGLIPASYLLVNKKGVFSDIAKNSPSPNKPGMVTDALWCDINGDTWPELIMVGEWMPLTIYKNNRGTLENTAIVYDNSYGWWNTIAKADLDGDGDMDLIGGNISINTRYRGNQEHPITMTVSDFDNNGSTDCVICLYQDGDTYPIAIRDNMVDQMLFLKKKFLRYRDYSRAKMTDIFTAEQLQKASVFKANNIANTVFINNEGIFAAQLLPFKAQTFPVNAVIADDFDKDGKPDLLLAGNDYGAEIESGRNDAGIGLVLKNNGGHKYRALSLAQSGFYVPGDVKCMKKITINKEPCLLIGKNQGELQVIGRTGQ